MRLPSYATDRMLITPHRFEVPVSWAAPGDGRKLQLFAREVVAVEKRDEKLPALCFFRGGPGFEAFSPERRSGWLEVLLERYRVILLDQRGTGLSSPFDTQAPPPGSPAQLAEYLRNFRAESIVRDAEHVRKQLLGDGARWTIYGQSFGGFCCLTYLSLFPEMLTAAIITGGFAPVKRTAHEVYAALVNRVLERNGILFQRYPGDAERVSRIVEALRTSEPRTAAGDLITARKFLAQGLKLGGRHGVAQIHTLIERADSDLRLLGRLGSAVLEQCSDVMGLTTNPLYALLHEAIYCQHQPSRWAAQRVISERPEFSLDAKPCPYFTGEMIFPWMFEELPALRPLAQVADHLAEYGEWPALYDLDRLARNEVPVVGTVYYDDFYVDRDFAIETASLIGNCAIWITNEHEHDGYTEEPETIFGRLFTMLDGAAADLHQSAGTSRTRSQGNA